MYAVAYDDSGGTEGTIDALAVGVGTRVRYRMGFVGGVVPKATLERLEVVGVPERIASGRIALRTVPNPSNGRVRFVLQGLTEGPVTWEVFDVRGRLVRRRTQMAARIGWDGTDEHGMAVAPGIYVVRVRQKDLVAKTRAVVMR